MPEMKSSSSRTVLSRAFAVMDLFLADSRPLALSEIAESTQLPLATVHHYLGELVGLDALERLPNGRYQLGSKMWLLGASSNWERLVRQTASPLLHSLSAKTGHAVALTTLNGDRLICLDRRWGRSSVISLADTGEEVPLLESSAGKVLLAQQSRGDVDHFLLEHESHAPAGSHASEDLVRKVDQARVNGYSIAIGEIVGIQSSISVQVGAAAHVLALTLLTPVEQVSLERFAGPLRLAARSLGEAISARAHLHTRTGRWA